jgi:hypothetical protein
MGVEYSTQQKPLTAEDVKLMKETIAANRVKDQTAAYNTVFENFKYFAVENFNKYLKEAVKNGWTKFTILSRVATLDSSIEKHLRDKELDKEWFYRCGNYYANTYPDFTITYEYDDAEKKMTYHVDISPKPEPAIPSEEEPKTQKMPTSE